MSWSKVIRSSRVAGSTAVAPLSGTAFTTRGRSARAGVVASVWAASLETSNAPRPANRSSEHMAASFEMVMALVTPVTKLATPADEMPASGWPAAYRDAIRTVWSIRYRATLEGGSLSAGHAPGPASRPNSERSSRFLSNARPRARRLRTVPMGHRSRSAASSCVSPCIWHSTIGCERTQVIAPAPHQ